MPQQPPVAVEVCDTTLSAIMKGTAKVQGDPFFPALVQYLAISLEVKAAFIAQFQQDRTVVQTLAVYVDGQALPNFQFPVQGTPCQEILKGTIQHFPDDVQTLFPTNALLRQLHARSYLAIPLSDERGSVLGHLAVIHDRPVEADPRQLAIFEIFAARATAEIISRQTSRELNHSLLREQKLKRDRCKMEAEVAYLKEELRARSDFEEIVGDSDAVWRVLRNIDMVAPTDSTVLIQGETGTGKELVASAIHRNSRRNRGPLVRVNCAALPETLLESELFGHEAGAFTGAERRRVGRFELANQGTIFLDEIGEMPLAAQSRLLRVIQEQQLERVGSSQTISVDCRIIAATHRDLPQMVEDGTFRQDLYYRLNVFPIRVPPLRDRREDIPILVDRLLQTLAHRFGKAVPTVPAETLQALSRYCWPGNIRELQNVVERAMILSPRDQLILPEGMLDIPIAAPQSQSNMLTLAESERNHIQSVLKRTEGRIAGPNGAAVILNVNPNTLRSRMAKLGIRTP